MQSISLEKKKKMAKSLSTKYKERFQKFLYRLDYEIKIGGARDYTSA